MSLFNFFKKPNERNQFIDAFRRLGFTINPHIYCNKKGAGNPPNDGKVYGQYGIRKDIDNHLGFFYFNSNDKLIHWSKEVAWKDCGEVKNIQNSK